MASSNATAWVLQAALQGLAAPSGKDFISASRFAGAKPGYVFKTGEHGLGYYLDPLQGGAAAAGGANGAAASGSGAGADGKGGSAPQQQQQHLDPEELLRQAEQEANIDQIQALDAKSLRRLVAGLDKKYKENMALRLKYADQPDKFLDSEVDLDEHIKSLMQVAGSPELYPVLLDGPCLSTLLALLSHENTDIAADVVELLAELTGADAAEEYGEEARGLVEGLVEANAPELLVQRLLAFKEEVEEEAKAVHNCLAVVENMVEIQPDLAVSFVDKTKLLTWLLRRLKRRDFDTNKQYTSEVLAVLMQGSVPNQARLGAENGIDLLLTCVAQYKSKDPSPGEEEEYMQNCFDVLCACLMQPPHKAAFVKAEGVELMHLMLQSRRQCRYGALKCLDYAATRFAPPAEKLVDLGGLKQLFGMFMGKARVKGPAGEHDVDGEVEERCVSLVASLLTQLPAAGRGVSRRERLMAKFVENEFEKTDRLMELLFKYQARVRTEEKRLAEALAEADEDEQVDEEELLLARLDAGLFPLQQCCLILGSLWATGDMGLRRRLLALLHQKGQSLGPVREILLEYYNSIGEEGGPDEASRARSHVRGLLESLGARLEEQQQQEGSGEGTKEGATGLREAKGREAAGRLAAAAAAADGREGRGRGPQAAAAGAGAGRRGRSVAEVQELEAEEGETMELDEVEGEGRRAAPPPPPLPPPLRGDEEEGSTAAPPPPSSSGRGGGVARGGEGRRKADTELMPPPPPPSGPAAAAAAAAAGQQRVEERGRGRGRERRGDAPAGEEGYDGEEAAGPVGRERERERERERDRDRDRESRLDREREQRQRDKEKDKDKDKDKEKEKERGDGAREREGRKDKDRDRERERDRDRDRRESFRREREIERDEQEYDERRKRDKDKDKGSDRERERERDRDRERDKDKDKGRDRERERERERQRDKGERDRERERERERR